MKKNDFHNMKNLIKIAIRKNIQVVVLLSVLFSYAQSGGRLYLSNASTGRIYDITGASKNLVAESLKSIASPTYFNQSRAALVSNLAVGYDNQSTERPLVFMHSNTAANSVLYKNGVTANTLPGVLIEGIGANNVLGPQFGNGYALSGKNLYRVYPTTSAAINITGDAIWNNVNTTIFATDTFFDYQNNIYTIVENVDGATYTRYLYQIKLNEAGTAATATQYKKITGPVGARNATAGSSTTTNTSNIQGVAYLNGNAFVVSGSGTSDILAYRIDISTGVSTYLRTYSGAGLGNSNMDLASVDYFQPFEFKCGEIAFQGTSPYVAGISSIQTLRVPIQNIYAPGTYTINVSGTGITTSAYNATVTNATTYLDVPVTYNGTGGAGSRTITLSLNGSTTTCTVDATIYSNSKICGEVIGSSNGFNKNVANSATILVVQRPVANKGFVVDIYTLDNSFNLSIEGLPTTASNTEIQFQSDVIGNPKNIEFADGTQYETGVPNIYDKTMTGTAQTPLLRLVVSDQGAITMFGSKLGNGQLFPLRLKTGMSAFNNLRLDNTNNVLITQLVTGPTQITGRIYGIIPCVCYEDPSMNPGTPEPTLHGITTLKRAGVGNGDWPMNRNSAFTALESNTRGLVITRMSTTELGQIAVPQDGMMVYDTTAKCLKIYTTDETTSAHSGWKCFTAPTCP